MIAELCFSLDACHSVSSQEYVHHAKYTRTYTVSNDNIMPSPSCSHSQGRNMAHGWEQTSWISHKGFLPSLFATLLPTLCKISRPELQQKFFFTDSRKNTIEVLNTFKFVLHGNIYCKPYKKVNATNEIKEIQQKD